MNIRTTELPSGRSKLLKNGSWTHGRGLLQRKEVDVSSFGSDINFNKCIKLSLLDCPFATYQNEAILIAASLTGTAPNMWVYVQVFGIAQWTIFLILLILMVVSLSLKNSTEAPPRPLWRSPQHFHYSKCFPLLCPPGHLLSYFL